MSLKSIRDSVTQIAKPETLPKKLVQDIEVNVQKSVEYFKDMVSRFPAKKHHKDIRIGNHKEISCKLANLIVEEYNKQLNLLGYGAELTAYLYSWSNIGDPFYMGRPEDISGYEVRIEEI